MIAASHKPDEVRYNQSDKTDYADRGNGYGGGKCCCSKDCEAKGTDWKTNDRRLGIAAREDVQVTRTPRPIWNSRCAASTAVAGN